MTIKTIYQAAIPFLFIFALVFGLRGEAAAQGEDAQGEPIVILDRVDDTLFPEVTAYIAVADERGLPILGLMPENFLISEDGNPVPFETVVAQNDTARELRLVLALDTSTTDAALNDIKAAAKALVDMLGPRDRTALITFGDEVEITYPLTNNQEELRTIIDELKPQGNFTSLNEALGAGIDLLAGLETGRKGMIVFTDRVDNVGSTNSAADDIIIDAQAAEAPLYLFGFGSRVQASVLDDLSRETGGLSKTVAASNELPAELQTLGVLLRQNYRITFRSSLTADDAIHNLSMAVRYQNRESQPVEVGFAARSTDVMVVLPTLVDGQTIEGPVVLDPQITTRAPIALVEYLLDDQPLIEISVPPYQYTWDASAAQPGAHTLLVRVTDIAGNEGQLSLNLDLEIPPSLVVTASTVQSNVKLGQEALVQAGVNPQEAVANVEFYLDDTLLGSDNVAPYSYGFDTADYQTGEHTIKVVAVDRAGQRVESTVSMAFLEVSAAERFLNSVNAAGAWIGVEGDLADAWPQLLARTIIVLIGLILIISIILTALRMIKRFLQTGSKDKLHTGYLYVYNLGNIRSRYELVAVDPLGILKFQFIMPPEVVPEPDIMLEQEGRSRPVPQTEPAQQPVTRSASTQVASTSQLERAERQTADQSSSRSVSVGGAVSSAQGKLSILNTVGDILGTIGSLLPGAAGRPLLSVANNLRQSSAQANRAINQPKQAMAAVKSAQAQASSLAPAKSTPASRQSNSSAARPRSPAQSPGPIPRPAPPPSYSSGSNPSSAPAAARTGSDHPLRPDRPVPPPPPAPVLPPARSRPASSPAPTPKPAPPPPPATAPARRSGRAVPSAPAPSPSSTSGPASSAAPVPAVTAVGSGTTRAPRRGSRYSRARRSGQEASPPATTIPAAVSSPDVATLAVEDKVSSDEASLDEMTVSGADNAISGNAAASSGPMPAPAVTMEASSANLPATFAPADEVESAIRSANIAEASKQELMASKTATRTKAQTPFVEAGDVLTVDLMIRPKDPYKAQDCSFIVSSSALEQAGIEPVIEQGYLSIEGIPLLRRILPFLLSLIIVIVAIALISGIAFVMINLDIVALSLKFSPF